MDINTAQKITMLNDSLVEVEAQYRDLNESYMLPKLNTRRYFIGKYYDSTSIVIDKKDALDLLNNRRNRIIKELRELGVKI